jgi:hypothetical protein
LREGKQVKINLINLLLILIIALICLTIGAMANPQGEWMQTLSRNIDNYETYPILFGVLNFGFGVFICLAVRRINRKKKVR